MSHITACANAEAADPPPAWHQGRLGADLAWSSQRKRWIVKRIPRGDSWVSSAASPLAAPGLGIREGDEILAVDGQADDPVFVPAAGAVERSVEQPQREDLEPVAQRLEAWLQAVWRDFYNPDVFRDVGLAAPHALMRAAWGTPQARRLRHEIAAPVTGFLIRTGALAGEAAHAQRVLAGLRAEGIDPVLVLWALAREIRALAAMATDLESGLPVARVLASHRVWEKRKPVIGSALQRVPARQWRGWLQRCARIDRVIKGRATGSCWDELLQLSLDLTGLDRVRVSV